MDDEKTSSLTRRTSAGTAAVSIGPRHVLGGAGFVPPSDKITLASIGLGFQGTTVTRCLLARHDVQVVAVCDCYQGRPGYVEWGRNGLLNAERRLLGPSYENWGAEMLRFARSGSYRATRRASASRATNRPSGSSKRTTVLERTPIQGLRRLPRFP